ncbi:RNase P modulator RnpM [Longirhabdus pacifica]|uniref:RNase P modulator RnpM n=1 Tax=Longirhabdus pacifica TaxID=2305227 RepID=UPI001008A2D6|nr:YlxR family protein [Longirhabdus pacifica]
MKTKRVPLRKCVACQAMVPKRQLIRIVKTSDDEVLVDTTGKKNGRGAYICGSPKSIELMKNTKCIERSLNTRISAEQYEHIVHQLAAVPQKYACESAGENHGGNQT